MALPEGLTLPKNTEDTRGLMRRYYALCLAFAIGTVVSIIGFSAILSDQTHDIKAAFHAVATDHFRLIESQMNDYQDQLLMLADVYAYQEAAPAYTMDLTETLPSGQHFLALQWWTEADINEGFSAPIPIPEPVRHMLTSKIVKKPLMSSMLTYNHTDDTKQVVALTVPVVSSGDYLGHIMGMVDIEKLANDVAAIDGNNDAFYAFDVTNPQLPELLYPATLSDGGGFNQIVDIETLYKYVPYYGETTARFWGREWRLILTPSVSRTAAVIGTAPWLVLVAGMVLTTAIALFLYSIIGKNARLQAVYDDIRQKEELLVLYTKHTPIAVAMFDKDLRYMAYSDRWVVDYGLQYEGNLVGRHHYELFPEIPVNYPQWVEEHKACLAGEVISIAKEPFVREDGVKEWLRYELRPWHKDGKVAGMIMFTEIITDRVNGDNNNAST